MRGKKRGWGRRGWGAGGGRGGLRAPQPHALHRAPCGTGSSLGGPGDRPGAPVLRPECARWGPGRGPAQLPVQPVRVSDLFGAVGWRVCVSASLHRCGRCIIVARPEADPWVSGSCVLLFSSLSGSLGLYPPSLSLRPYLPPSRTQRPHSSSLLPQPRWGCTPLGYSPDAAKGRAQHRPPRGRLSQASSLA